MKKNRQKKSFSRQLVSGLVYCCLAALVVAVTVNTTVGIISNRQSTPLNENLSSLETDLPSIPPIPSLTLPSTVPDNNDDDDNTLVNDIEQGIDSVITQEPVIEQITIPEDAYLGFDKYINPCGGYVSREFSIDIPVYCPTMSDYRTHSGIDIVGELGTPVLCAMGGVVTDIYNDDLYGVTVCTKTADGYTLKYSNLMEALHANVAVGAILETGDEISGIGKTAICEAADTPHLHFEMTNNAGELVDPADYIPF